jgi:hypothetical protein
MSMYAFIYNLLNALVQIAKKVDFKKYLDEKFESNYD